LYDKNGIGNQYIGGNFNSLFSGIIGNAMRDATIITPRVANFAAGDPTIPFAVFLSGGSGFNHGNFVRTLISPTGTAGPTVGVFDRDTATSTNLVIEGNRFKGRIEVAQNGGTRGLLFGRADLNEKFSFGASSSGAFMYDEIDARMMWRAQSSGTDPRFLIGTEDNSHGFTGSRLSAATRAAGGTDLAGTDLYLDAGFGTGSNVARGVVIVRTPVNGTSGTSAQAMAERFRVKMGGQVNFPQTDEPTVGIINGDMFYGVISGVTNFWFRRTNGWVGLP
jgi:hypothetical protein